MRVASKPTVKKKSVVAAKDAPVTLDSIRAVFGRVRAERIIEYLDLGPELNMVIGHRKRGLRYGSIVELSGELSCGKTAIMYDIFAAHQAISEDHIVVLIDLENSFEQPRKPTAKQWPQLRGVECHRGSASLGVAGTNKFYLIQPYLTKMTIKKNGQKKVEKLLSTAEMLLAEAQALIEALYAENPKRRFILGIDSVAALQAETAAVAEAAEGANMKSALSTAVMLSRLMPKWVGLLPEVMCTAVFINQIRVKPGAYGDPRYTTGGNALPFYCHSRVRLSRFGRLSLIKQNGSQIGIQGIAKATKNKLGGRENEEITYKIYYDGRSRFEMGGKKFLKVAQEG